MGGDVIVTPAFGGCGLHSRRGDDTRTRRVEFDDPTSVPAADISPRLRRVVASSPCRKREAQPGTIAVWQ